MGMEDTPVCRHNATRDTGMRQRCDGTSRGQRGEAFLRQIVWRVYDGYWIRRYWIGFLLLFLLIFLLLFLLLLLLDFGGFWRQFGGFWRGLWRGFWIVVVVQSYGTRESSTIVYYSR